MVHEESTVVHGWECTYSRNVRGGSSLEVANKPAWPGSVCRHRHSGGKDGGGAGRKCHFYLLRTNKQALHNVPKETSRTSRLYRLNPSALSDCFEAREDGMNSSVITLQGRYRPPLAGTTEFFIFISLNFHLTSFWITWWRVGWFNNGKQLRCSTEGGLVSLKCWIWLLGDSSACSKI